MNVSRLPSGFDPRSVPVEHDANPPQPIGAERLTASALRQRFQSPPDWLLEFQGDGRFWTDREPAEASVLVPLLERHEGIHVLLTRRTAHLRDHAGQISFPGGRAEPEDAGPIETALREAQEEVGLDPQSIDVLGTLPVYATVTRFNVTPAVALLRQPLNLRLDPDEVDECFEVPLAFLMSPRNHRKHRADLGEQSRYFLSMPWRPPNDPEREYFIWGATAAMLRNLYRFLAA